MSKKEFDYDVAISFLSQDESTAHKLHSLLSDLNVFIYSRKQEDVVGKDGIEIFRAVFYLKSKIVVVFFRESWGNTPFTFIEEEAIKDRIHKEKNYNFLIMVNLTGEEQMPDWMPKRINWFDYKKYGLKGLAGAILQKINDLGIITRAESAEEISERKANEIEFNFKRNNFVNSEEAVKLAGIAFNNLAELFANKTKAINNKHLEFIQDTTSHNKIVIKGNFLTLNISWWPIARNTLEIETLGSAYLDISIMKRNLNVRDNNEEYAWNKIHNSSYNFDLFYPNLTGWRKVNGYDYIPSQNLVENTIRLLLENVDSKR